MADLNETIAKLSESLSQHSATALVNLSLPEFNGSPNQDINTFLKKFKSATITLNDSLKCLALERSLVGPAHTWAKNHVKSDLRAGNWRATKQALLKRFQAPDQPLRNLNKLTNLKYNPSDMTLSSYVEVFVDTYRKVYPGCADQDVIRNLALKLTPEILLHLNMLSDSWTTFEFMDDFMTLVQRVEHKILPYEKSTKTDDNSNLVKLTEVIQDLRNTVINRGEKEKAVQPEQTEVIAAVVKEPLRYPKNNQQQVAYPGNHNPYPQNYGNQHDQYQGNYRPQNSHPNAMQNQFDNRERNKRGNNYQRINDHDKRPKTDTTSRNHLQRQYEQRFGKPPGPCYTCGANHFNKHCPYNELKN